MRGPGRKFEKGKSGNPGGLSKKKRQVLAFQQIKYDEFVLKLQMFGHCTKNDIKKVIDDPKTTTFDLIYCRHIYDAMTGDNAARESLYNRLWGKVKDKVEINDTRSQITNMSINQLVAIIKDMPEAKEIFNHE